MHTSLNERSEQAQCVPGIVCNVHHQPVELDQVGEPVSHLQKVVW